MRPKIWRKWRRGKWCLTAGSHGGNWFLELRFDGKYAYAGKRWGAHAYSKCGPTIPKRFLDAAVDLEAGLVAQARDDLHLLEDKAFLEHLDACLAATEVINE